MFSNIRSGLLGLFYLFVSENVGRKFVRTKKCHGTLEVTKKEKNSGPSYLQLPFSDDRLSDANIIE